jgi:hypothetical protein
MVFCHQVAAKFDFVCDKGQFVRRYRLMTKDRNPGGPALSQE